MNFRLLQTLATAACAIAAIYLLSILVTGGYGVNFAGVRFDANKLWPAIVAMLGFALLRVVFRHGSIEGALQVESGIYRFLGHPDRISRQRPHDLRRRLGAREKSAAEYPASRELLPRSTGHSRPEKDPLLSA